MIMAIRKIKLQGQIRWEVAVRPYGNGRKKIRRRFKKRLMLRGFLNLYKKEKETP